MAERGVSDKKRAWTLAGARALLGDVRERTARAVEKAELLQAVRDDATCSPEEHAEAEQELQRCVSLWIREMEALGLEVKGAWLVDFDNGSGYYCWRWPEEELEYFHGYEEGFEGRSRIQ